MMTTSSSHDLLADRRYAWAMALLARDDVAGAADLLEQVADLVPHWAPAWSALGDARDRLGADEAAHAAWIRASALDPEGRLGAALKIARRAGDAPAAMPAAYVAALFDDYAPRFDRHLVEKLRYRGPDLLLGALDKAAPERVYDRALDLGCGTGLMGRSLAGRIRHLDGIDLSPAMVARARLTGFYTTLTVASIEATFATSPGADYDLVTAADVLVYVGDLAPVFAGTHRVLVPGGLLAFTLQTLAASGREPVNFRLGADMRFAHEPAYVEAGLEAAGFAVLSLDVASTRDEKGVSVPGLVGVARRLADGEPAATTIGQDDKTAGFPGAPKARPHPPGQVALKPQRPG